MRGFSKGKEATVIRVSYGSSKVYLEGISNRTARGKEVLYAFEPSNLLLLATASAKTTASTVINQPTASAATKSASTPALAPVSASSNQSNQSGEQHG